MNKQYQNLLLPAVAACCLLSVSEQNTCRDSSYMLVLFMRLLLLLLRSNTEESVLRLRSRSPFHPYHPRYPASWTIMAAHVRARAKGGWVLAAHRSMLVSPHHTIWGMGYRT